MYFKKCFHPLHQNRHTCHGIFRLVALLCLLFISLIWALVRPRQNMTHASRCRARCSGHATPAEASSHLLTYVAHMLWHFLERRCCHLFVKSRWFLMSPRVDCRFDRQPSKRSVNFMTSEKFNRFRCCSLKLWTQYVLLLVNEIMSRFWRVKLTCQVRPSGYSGVSDNCGCE